MKLLPILVLAALVACDSGSGNVRLDLGALHERAALAGFTLDTLAIRVSGPGMVDQRVAIADDVTEVTIIVPAGPNRRFEIEATRLWSDGTDVPAFDGASVVDVTPGSTVVEITASPVGAIDLLLDAGSDALAGTEAPVVLTTAAYATQNTLIADGTVQRIVAPVGDVALSSDAAELELFATTGAVVRQGEVTSLSAYVVTRGERCAPGTVGDLQELDPPCAPISVSVFAGADFDLALSLYDASGRLLETVPVTTAGTFQFNYRIPAGEAYSIGVTTVNGDPNPVCALLGGIDLVAGAQQPPAIICDTGGGVGYTVAVSGDVGDGLSVQLITTEGVYDATFTGPGSQPLGAVGSGDFTLSIASQPTSAAGPHRCGVIADGDMQSTYSGTFAATNGIIRINCTAPVQPYFATSAWNDYYAIATDRGSAVCSGAPGAASSCSHAGERHVVELPGITSCLNVFAADILGMFQWTCVDEDVGTPGVIVVSMRLAHRDDQRYLRSLIDLSLLTPRFRENAVRVTTPNGPYVTADTVWFTNPIALSTDAGLVGGEVVVARSSQPVQITNSRTAVITDGVTVEGSASQPAVLVDDTVYTWIEGDYSGVSGATGLSLSNAAFAQVRGAVVIADGNAIDIAGGFGVAIEHAVITSTFDGIRVDSDYAEILDVEVLSAGNNGIFVSNGESPLLQDVYVSNAGSTGIYFNGPTNNAFLRHGTVAHVPAGSGLFISANNVTVVDLRLFANGTGLSASLVNNLNFNGLTLMSNAVNMVLDQVNGAIVQNVSSLNATDGLVLSGSTDNFFAGLLFLNHGTGIRLSGGATGNHFNDLGLIANDVGIDIVDGSVVSSGTWRVDAVTECVVQISELAAGLRNGLCTTDGVDGSSLYPGSVVGATLRVGYSGDSFIGIINSDDFLNASDVPGGFTADANTDWLNFEVDQRGFVVAAELGRNLCDLGETCQVFDARLVASDFVDVRDVRPYTHTWYTVSPPTSQADCDTLIGNGSFFVTDHCENEVLLGAQGGAGFCQANEFCLSNTNFGSYFGQGPITDVGTVALARGNVAVQRYVTRTAVVQ